jgi:DNA-binding NarL/FixJ family response regulator
MDSMVHASRLDALAAASEFTLLSVTLLSTLVYRVQRDRPDVIVIAAAEAFPEDRRGLAEVFSDAPAVLLAAQANAAAVRNAARVGIHSVVPMTVSTQQLRAAISATVAGFAVTPPRSPAPAASTMRVAEELTGREVEVLRLMARGQRNKQLAAQLKISEHTAKFHVSSVLAKLGARTRTEAVTIGMTRGLVAI